MYPAYESIRLSPQPSEWAEQAILLYNHYRYHGHMSLSLLGPGGTKQIWRAEDLLLCGFGFFLASAEEPASSLSVISGSTLTAQRVSAGDPLFQISGTREKKVEFLCNLADTVPSSVRAPIGLVYQDNEVWFEYSYEIKTVIDAIRITIKP